MDIPPLTPRDHKTKPVSPAPKGGETLVKQILGSPLPQEAVLKLNKVVYNADRIKKYLSTLTLEEKVGQLIIWEVDLQERGIDAVGESMVLERGIGGVFFHEGDDTREQATIDRLQSLSHVPLLIGHSLERGLLYCLPMLEIEHLDIDDYESMGEKMAIQNRELGVHIQCIASVHEQLITRPQQQALCSGILKNGGLYGIYKSIEKNTSEPVVPMIHTALMYQKNDVLLHPLREANKEECIALFQEGFDMILIRDNPAHYIDCIVALVRDGTLSEGPVDEKLYQILLWKSLFFDECIP